MPDLFENSWNLIQKGDKKSFDAVYHKLYRSLCLYAFSIIKDFQLSEELVNDVFLKIWLEREKLNIKGSIQNYLFQAIHNQSLNLLRNLTTEKSKINRRVDDFYWKFIQETYIINDFLLENIIAEETKIKLKDTINSLPDQCREIFVLSRFKGKTNKEIAKRLNLTENTVRVQIFRALHKIKEVLKISRKNIFLIL